MSTYREDHATNPCSICKAAPGVVCEHDDPEVRGKSSIFRCPKCQAKPNEHGRGGLDKCQDPQRTHDSCQGFLCQCDEDGGDTHGETPDDPCTNPVCYHCGWNENGGKVFPAGAINPKKLRGWAKTAWEAGWRPPSGWQP